MVHGLTVSIVVTFTWIVLHIIAMHVRPAENRVGSMTLGFLISLPFVYIAWRWLPMPAFVTDGTPEPAGLQLFHACICQLLFYFLYAECFYHVERAVTARILIEIMQHPDHAPRIDEIREEYNLGDMITQRLLVLQDHRFVRQEGERWVLRPKGKLFARTMQVSAWIYQSKSQREKD